MKKKIRLHHQIITSVIIILIILGCSFISIRYSGTLVMKELQDYQLMEEYNKLSSLQLSAEEVIRHEFRYYRELRDLFSFGLVLQAKKESNDFYIVKDENKFLHYANFYDEIDPMIASYAKRMKRLQEAANLAGSAVIFVGTAGKYIPGISKFPEGYPSHDVPIRNLDELLLDLYANQVPFVDLREFESNLEQTYVDYYYKTDSKWNTKAAMQAANVITKSAASQFSQLSSPSEYFMAENQYENSIYKDAMFGDQARTAGIPFSGTEDLVIVKPIYYTSITYENLESGFIRRGMFEQSILNQQKLIQWNKRYFDATGIFFEKDVEHFRLENHIINSKNKILFLTDEFFLSTAAYLSLLNQEVEVIVMNNQSSTLIEKRVSSEEFDLIIVACEAPSIEESMFAFFQ